MLVNAAMERIRIVDMPLTLDTWEARTQEFQRRSAAPGREPVRDPPANRTSLAANKYQGVGTGLLSRRSDESGGMLQIVDVPSGNRVADMQATHAAPELDEADRKQIAERLRWTPKQRLEYLLDMLAFEERARRAHRLEPKR